MSYLSGIGRKRLPHSPADCGPWPGAARYNNFGVQGRLCRGVWPGS